MREFVVGTDIGGTFTDVVAIDDAGVVSRTKALTTPAEPSDGVMEGIGLMAEKFDLGIEEFLGQVKVLINGSTVATNVIAQLRGAKVGLITTRGFRDTVRMARSYRWNTYDLHQQISLPELVTRENTIGVAERVDYKGQVVVPLDEDEVREAARQLVEEAGVECIAVSFLWSPKNPDHELRVREIVNEDYPDVTVSVSHELFGGIREYERTNTALINAYVSPVVNRYARGLEERLRAKGFNEDLNFMHSMGGMVHTEELVTAPLGQVLSGPVGGVMGANYLGKLLGVENLITADVGGTSFDAAVVHENEPTIASRIYMKVPGNPGPGFLTGLSMVDISAIGAGGGSIAWVDDRNLLRVGPHSAGADPGPAAFDKGGTQPTLTDACIALGIVDPDYFLGGSIKVRRDLAEAAIREVVADKIGLSVSEAAGAIYKIMVTTMALNVRSVSIQKGHDPREFAMVSFGGAGGMILPAVCRESLVKELIVPDVAAVFSAFGLLSTDYKRDYMQTVHWRSGSDADNLNDALAGLRERGEADLRAAGFESDVNLQYEADMRFVGQFFELQIPIPKVPVGKQELADLERAFNEAYEREYGAGAAWVGAPVETVNVRLHASAPVRSFERKPEPAGDPDPSAASRGEREVVLPGSNEARRVPTFSYEGMEAGMTVSGPSVVEGADTTVLLLEGMEGRMDEYGNLRVRI